MDELVVKFEAQLVKDIQESGLPLQVVRLVLMEVQNSVIVECNRLKEGETNGEQHSTDRT